MDITDNPLFLIINKEKEIKAHFLVHDKFEETSYDILQTDELWKQFIHVRLNTILPLACEATIPGVKNLLQNKRKKVDILSILFTYILNTSFLVIDVLDQHRVCKSNSCGSFPAYLKLNIFQIASGQVSFNIDGTSVYLFGVASDVGVTGTSMDSNVGEFIDSVGPEQSKKKKYIANKVVSY